jgi:outer membrane protein assembly factor BamB
MAILVPGVNNWNPGSVLKIQSVPNPSPLSTLGAAAGVSQISGPPDFSPTVLIQPLDAALSAGVDLQTIRFFKFNEKTSGLEIVWHSGFNTAAKFIWAKITSPGIYMPIGLPEDPLVRESLFRLAQSRRRYLGVPNDGGVAMIREAFGHVLETPEEEFHELRKKLARTMAGLEKAGGDAHTRRGRAGHVMPHPLPGNEALPAFREKIRKLRPGTAGLAEEALFHRLDDEDLRRRHDSGHRHHLWPWPLPFPWPLPCWFFSQDWWMYHGNEAHTGAASGCSGIESTNVNTMNALPPVNLDGLVITIPSIVGGKIYVGTVHGSATPGIMYKIDLASGNIDGSYALADTVMSSQGYCGVGGSPAVVNGNIYFTSFGGNVYCVDSTSMTLVWQSNLNTPSQNLNQPVSNPNADTWTSPLVVNGKVYVGTGEGEQNGFGFVWCLDAGTGKVLWLFCTNQFSGGNDGGQTNLPNRIPKSAVPGGVLPAWATDFVVQNDPPYRGCSPWSSMGYDAGLNRIYFGMGNSTANGPLPDAWYGSGAMGLDADTGVFQGYNAPQAYDAYYPGDSDADMPSSPTIFTRNGQRVIGIGSKIGSFLIYDTKTMGQLNSRQLLPKDAVTGKQLPNVDPGGAGGGENYYGIFGTAAVDYNSKRLFVGLGGYGPNGIDTSTTPFVRALNWGDLSDAWPTAVKAVGANQVALYNVGPTPLYSNPGEAGLSSPAVVNDVVFVSTSLPALYAFDINTGLHLWTAPGIPAAMQYVMGPAIYGNYVVIGCGSSLYTFQLP